MIQAAAPFIIEGWEETTILDQDGVRVYSTHLTKRLEGDLEGTSVGDMIMVHVGEEPAAYCGFEHVTGILAGRAGAFLFHHNAAAGIEGGLSITVVPGSATGELKGLLGSASIDVSGQVGDVKARHRLLFDYRLEGVPEPPRN